MGLGWRGRAHQEGASGQSAHSGLQDQGQKVRGLGETRPTQWREDGRRREESQRLRKAEEAGGSRVDVRCWEGFSSKQVLRDGVVQRLEHPLDLHGGG